MHVLRLQIMANFELENQATHRIEHVYKGRVETVWPTSEARSEADPGLVCPAAATVAVAATFAGAVVYFAFSKEEHKRHGYADVCSCGFIHHNPYPSSLMHDAPQI